MTDSKFLELIRSFTAEERAEFPLFLKSPYFLKDDNEGELLLLYQCIETATREVGQPQLEKTTVHDFVFPNKPYSESRLYKVLNRLGQLIEQFFQIRYYQRESNEQQRLLDLIHVFRDRNLVSFIQKRGEKLKSDLLQAPRESTDNYLLRYRMAREEHEWLSTFNNASDDLRIPAVLESLDLFYHTERLELLNRFLLQQKAGLLETPEVIQSALAHAHYPEYYEQQSPLLQIRKKIQDLFLLPEPGKEGFEVLMALLKKHENDLSDKILPDLYSFLRSYCAYLINLGLKELFVILHALHKDNLARGYFYHGGRITPFSMMAIVKAAISSNSVQWAKEFLEAHRHRILTDQDSDEIYGACLALCLFAERKFDFVLEHISLNARNHLLLTLSRRLEIMVYYELESELLPFKIDAFKKYLKRTASKKMPSLDWQQNNNFINLLLQISQTAPKDAKRSARLVQRIRKIKVVSEQHWLLEKAEALA